MVVSFVLNIHNTGTCTYLHQFLFHFLQILKLELFNESAIIREFVFALAKHKREILRPNLLIYAWRPFYET